MTHKTFIYYTAAAVSSCFLATISIFSFSKEFYFPSGIKAIFAFFTIFLLSMFYGGFGTVLMAFLLKRFMQKLGWRYGWEWSIAGIAIAVAWGWTSFGLITLLVSNHIGP